MGFWRLFWLLPDGAPGDHGAGNTLNQDISADMTFWIWE